MSSLLFEHCDWPHISKFQQTAIDCAFPTETFIVTRTLSCFRETHNSHNYCSIPSKRLWEIDWLISGGGICWDWKGILQINSLWQLWSVTLFFTRAASLLDIPWMTVLMWCALGDKFVFSLRCTKQDNCLLQGICGFRVEIRFHQIQHNIFHVCFVYVSIYQRKQITVCWLTVLKRLVVRRHLKKIFFPIGERSWV